MEELYIHEGITYNVSSERLNEFLTKFQGAQKVSEVGKTNDSSTGTPTAESNVTGSNLETTSSESQKPSFTFDPSIFGEQDEDAVAKLNAKYGDVFKFSQRILPKFYKGSDLGYTTQAISRTGGGQGEGYASMSGIVVSTLDGEHEAVIETGISADKYETQDFYISKKGNFAGLDKNQRRLMKATSDLNKFFETHGDPSMIAKINEKKQKNKEAAIKWNQVVNPDIELIEAEFSATNSPDLFKPVTETIRVGGYTSPTTGISTSGSYKTITTQPYEKELKQAMKDLTSSTSPLLESGPRNLDMEKVEARAREIIIENKRLELKVNKKTDLLNDLEGNWFGIGKELPASLAEYEGNEEALKASLVFGQEQLNVEYAAKQEIFKTEIENLQNNKESNDFISLKAKLEDPDFQFEIQPNEQTVTLKNGKVVPKSVVDDLNLMHARLKPKYDTLFKLQSDLFDNRFNIQDKELTLDLLKRDYNDTEQFFALIGAGFGDLFNNIGGATENIKDHERWQRNRQNIQAFRDKYQAPVDFDNAFSSPKNFGKFVLQEFGNQIPIFASLSVPYAGWGTLLASSFGEQYGEMTAKEIEGLKDYSIWEKVYTSAGYAIPELAFELMTTVPLLRGAGNAMRGLYGNSFRELMEVGMYQFAKENTPTFARGAILESLGEGATTLTQNVVTGKKWHENVDHSLFSGLMFGTTLASVPMISGAIQNQLGDYKSSEEFRENLKEINKLKQDNKNLDLKIKLLRKRGKDGRNKEIIQAEKDKVQNNSRIKDISGKNTLILQNQKEGILGRWLGWGKINKNGMSAGAMKGYLNITAQQEQLRIEAEKIQENQGFSDSEKQRRLKDLWENGAIIDGKQVYGWQVLQDVRDRFRNQKNSEFNLWAADRSNKAEYDKLIKEAKDYLNNQDSEGTPDWVKSLKTGIKEPEDVARILWNIQQINKNLKQGKGNTKISKDLVVFDTVKDAEAGLDSEIYKDTIKAIKKGAHGFDDGGKSYIIVENMAKDDRLETKTHELSHRFLTNAVQADPQAFEDISKTIFEWAKENDEQLYNRLLTQALTVDSAPDEILAVFLEEAAAERIDLGSQNIGGMVGHMAGKVMKDNYGVDMDFAGQSDAIKMLVGLGKKLKAGKLTLKDQAAFLESMKLKQADTKGKADKVMIDQLNEMRKMVGLPPITMTKLSDVMGGEGSQTTIKSTLFKETNDALIEALNLYGIPNPERLLSEDIEVRKELEKEWEALGDSRLWLGSLIGEKWKKFLEVNYLSKRDKAANYELYKDQIIDVAATGVETGDNGIPFLVRSWKPAEEGGRTLTSHIFGEIETRLMAKGGIIDRKFPQFDKFISPLDMSRDDGGVDIEGDLGIDAVLAAEERKRKRKENLEEDRYRKLIGIDDKLAAEIKSGIQEVLLSGDLGLIDDFDWTQRFSKASQDKLFKIIKKQMKDYEAFLKKTKTPFMKHAHTSDLVQMEKRESKKILAKLKSGNTSPLQIKLGFLEGLIQPFEVKSMTSGPNIYDKLDPSTQEFIDFMKVRGRKDAFVKNNINIMAMDAVFDVLLNQTVEVDGKQVRVLDQFIKQQQELGLPSASNVLAIIKERINRDQDVKFSKTVRDFNPTQMAIFYDSLGELGKRIDLTNVGDEEIIRSLVDELYGGFLVDNKAVFTKTQLKNLSKDLFKLIKQYAVINKNHANLKTKPKDTLIKYLHNEIDAGVLQQTLRDVLGIDEDLAKSFDNTARIKNQRAAILDIGKGFIKKYGREQALMMMIHAGGMYSTSTQISRGNHIVDSLGNVIKITKDQITKVSKKTGKVKTEFSSQRYQSFTGKKDWNRNLLKRLFPELQLTDAGNLKKFQTIDGVVVDTSLLEESSKKGMEDKNFEARKAQAKLSEMVVRDLAQYYKDKISKGKLDKIDFGMLMMSMASNMDSPLKRAANLKYIYKDKDGKKYKGKLRYEHMIPTNFMVLAITDVYMSKNSDIDLDALFNEYTVAIIPRDMDDILEEMGYQYVMPFGYDGKQTSRVRYYNMKTFGHPDLYAIQSIDPKDKGKVYGQAAANIKYSKNIDEAQIVNKAVIEGRKANKKPRGITVLDFDDTLATTKSLVRYTAPDGTTGTLNAEQYASTYQDLLEQGYTFDFSEFNKVVKGKIAPLFQKALKLQSKFGPANMFVLTARPPQAAQAIFDFLKANGLNIPLKNITGLANSTSEAKALWIAEKVGEGYNDFYFADDALQNVQAVKNMLDQFDVKSKVQQAKVKLSDTLNEDFNQIIEDVTGVDAKKRFAATKARKRGGKKGKFRVFIPPSHEDFVGLIYNFLGKGEQGNRHRDFFEKHLIQPLNRAYREYDTLKQSIANDYKNLNKQMKDVRKKLRQTTPDGDFTYQDAVRVYIWDKHGYNIPGLSKSDQKMLSKLVKEDADLQAYAETVNKISRRDNYIEPTESWDVGDIRTDLTDATDRLNRLDLFEEFFENADIIFSTENLNKIEAAYGTNLRSALEDMLYRIKTGRNRPKGQNETVNRFVQYLNGSVGSVMFFNTRSALLQQMSMVNYLNFSDNNLFLAAKAFANQKQYWEDWAFIFNSDMLKQRRGGIQTDVNGAELAQAVSGAKFPGRMLIKKLLELGFLPTQIGDNIAIATGGATFYRNRINTYLKEGLSKKEAEAKAFSDLQQATQSTQQSARPDMVSQQQAGIAGKIILNFQNVTSQYNRLIKKSALDLKNRRMSPPYKTQLQSDAANISRILYYGAVQNLVFMSLQQALFMMLFEDDEENERLFDTKKERVLNGSLDSLLRGSGVYGAVISTLKNMAIAFAKQRDLKYNPDEASVVGEMLNLSPVIGIKVRKIVTAEKTLNSKKRAIEELDKLDLDNPVWSATTNYIEGITNAPVNRIYTKTQNVRGVLNNEHTAFQRFLLFSGYNEWGLGIKNPKVEEANRRKKSKRKRKTSRRTL